MDRRALVVVVYDMDLNIPHGVTKRDELVLEIVFAPFFKYTGAAEIVIWACSVETLESDASD
jgi:hypothetical protein